MRKSFVSLFAILIIIFAAFTSKHTETSATGYFKNIKFNHLYVVLDDSSYKFLFDSLGLSKEFAKTSEETLNADNKSWTGKYVYGINNYLEFFKPDGIKDSRPGDVGLGFITNKLGTINLLEKYWVKTIDSVHAESRVITDNGKTSPWFRSISIPNVDSLKINAWVFENAREEMEFAGFSPQELLGQIEYSDYYKHMRAKFKNVPVDSIKNDRLFNAVTSLNLKLTNKELAYLKKFLLDIGFKEKNKTFSKENFKIGYTLTDVEQPIISEIGFSLLKKMPHKLYSLKNINMVMNGTEAKMKFR